MIHAEIHQIDKSRARQGERSTEHEAAEKRWKLADIIREIELQESLKKDAQECIKAALDTAKAHGFDKDQIKQIIKNRADDQFSFDLFAEGVQHLTADLKWAEENPRWKKAV